MTGRRLWRYQPMSEDTNTPSSAPVAYFATSIRLVLNALAFGEITDRPQSAPPRVKRQIIELEFALQDLSDSEVLSPLALPCSGYHEATGLCMSSL
jgi:hypothetical protein